MRPLAYAASFHEPEDVRLFLEHRARREEANPLYSAAMTKAQKDRLPSMAYLVDECKIDGNAISNFGHRMWRRGNENGTSLQQAVHFGDRARIAYVLTRGADPNVKSVLGHDAFMFAEHNEYHDRLGLLEELVAAQRSSWAYSQISLAIAM